VTSPRGEELDENGLAGGFGVPILRIFIYGKIDKNEMSNEYVRTLWVDESSRHWVDCAGDGKC
jgi:hypothetical protein